MNKTGIIALIVVVVLAVGGGVFAVSRRHQNQTSTPAQTTPTTASNSTDTATPADTSTQSTNAQPGANTITYTNNGFSPATLTVQKGAKVTVTNNSSSALQFDSDPHPEHTDDPELNIGVIAPGHSKTITVTTTGSHGYHNHLNADDTGTLIVQ